MLEYIKMFKIFETIRQRNIVYYTNYSIIKILKKLKQYINFIVFFVFFGNR